jgi:WXG100 family type VII secretion target
MILRWSLTGAGPGEALVRETIAVTPEAVRAVAGDVRRLAGELRGASAQGGAGACRVSGALAGASARFDAMWLAWSTALDQVATALEGHARTLVAAAGDYGEADTGAVPNLAAGR